MTKKIIK